MSFITIHDFIAQERAYTLIFVSTTNPLTDFHLSGEKCAKNYSILV